jgi:hypothetical protein
MSFCRTFACDLDEIPARGKKTLTMLQSHWLTVFPVRVVENRMCVRL